MDEEKYDVVRIRAELIPLIDKLVDETKDEYGTPVFHSRQEVVSEGVKLVLKKYSKKEKEAPAK